MTQETARPLLLTKNHIVTVAPRKNRIYATIRGFVKRDIDPESLMEKLHALRQDLSCGFTVLLDASQVAIQTQEAAEFLRYFQEMIVEGGVSKMAEVLPDSNLIQVQHRQIAEMTGMAEQRKVFTSRENAEIWLDAFPR